MLQRKQRRVQGGLAPQNRQPQPPRAALVEKPFKNLIQRRSRLLIQQNEEISFCEKVKLNLLQGFNLIYIVNCVCLLLLLGLME